MRSLRISNELPGSDAARFYQRNYVVKLSAILCRKVEVSLNAPAQLSLPLYLPDDRTFAEVFWPGDNAPLYWPRCKTCCAGNMSGYISTFGRVKARAAAICCAPALNYRSVECGRLRPLDTLAVRAGSARRYGTHRAGV